MHLSFQDTTPKRLIHPLTGEVLIEGGQIVPGIAVAEFYEENPLSPIIKDPVLQKLWEGDLLPHLKDHPNQWEELDEQIANMNLDFEGDAPYLVLSLYEPTEKILLYRNYPEIEPQQLYHGY
jgi:hypothetical protein